MQKVKSQEKNKESLWTEQEKKKYLEFIIQYLPKLNQRVPRNFFNKMSKTISNSKTPTQCSSFHDYRKEGCQTLEQLIQKVTKQIGGNPSLPIKYQDEDLIAQPDKRNYFQKIQKNKSIEEDVLKQFMKDFNPYEITFKPDKNIIHKKLFDEHLLRLLSWEEIFYRPLESKLYPFKQEVESHKDDEEDDDDNDDDQNNDYNDSQGDDEDKNSNKDYYDSDNGVEQDRMIDQRDQKKLIQPKKKIILLKREIKSENQHRMKNSIESCWTKYEQLKFLVFLMSFKKYFEKSEIRERSGIFLKMSSFIRTRNSKKCYDYLESIQKQSKLNKSIDSVIDFLQKNIRFTKKQIQIQIENIKNFYQDVVKKQCNALNPVQLSLCFLNDNNQKPIRQIVGKYFQIQQLKNTTDHFISSKKETLEIQKFKNQIQLPIIIIISFMKQLKPKTKRQKKNEILEQNEEVYNTIQKRSITTGNSKKVNDLKKKDTSNEQSYQESKLFDQKIEHKQGTINSKRDRQKWSVSEDIKVLAYFMVNQRLLQKIESKHIRGFFVKLPQYFYPSKNLQQCWRHFDLWKKRHNNDEQKTINEQAKRLCIKAEMIEERKQICMQVNTVKIKVGSSRLELDHLPQKITLKRQDFSAESVAIKIYQAKPFLSFYLTFQDKSMDIEQHVDKQKEPYRQEKCKNVEIEHQSLINAQINLSIDEQRFEKLRQGLQFDKGSQQFQKLTLSDDVIQIRIKTRQTYQFILDNLS